MSEPLDRLESLFAATLQKSPEERAAFLDKACADDPSLRRRVEALVHAQEAAGSFLELPDSRPEVTLEKPIREGPGTVIGPYKLLEQIGEGGFGVVFMAEQTQPVRRKVALKILKPGMDTHQVVARFEAERQALAIMDHPHIAKVYDGGATPSGRPYFVMELVRGAPITEFCDQRRLAPRERLGLFVNVCQAVQHAHQKGILHRDLKPSNVLVSMHDTTPVVKVIDFGVAKAMGQELTEKTLFTSFAQMVGTPLYMSPEQAGESGLDIDTRSDIYSLGVLLYELLTGTTPFDKERFKKAAYEEIRRIIRDEEPPRPSTRLSDSKDSLPSISAQRHTEPAKLTRLVRGELDWIVMKALEKDRTRRYETANAFALDVQRYLNDEQVQACPPSTAYRFRKFARRNKATLATATMVAAALVAGIIGTTWQAVRATHEAERATTAETLAQERYTAERTARAAERAQRQIADQQRKDAIEARNLARQKAAEALAALTRAETERQRAEENFDKARRAVETYLNQVTESELLTVPGLQPLRQDLLDAALKFYSEFTLERGDDPTIQRDLASAHYRLGRIHHELGDADASRAANAEAIRLYEKLRDDGRLDRDLQAALAQCYYFAKRYDDAVKLCQEVLLAEATHTEARRLLADTNNALALDANDKNDIEAAFKHHQQAFELREALVRDFPDAPRHLANLGGTINNLGVLLSRQGKGDESAILFERSVEYSAQAYEREPHSILWGRWLCTGLTNLACCQRSLAQDHDALATYQRLVAVSRKRAFENPAVASLKGELCQAYLLCARYQQRLGNTAEASRSFRDARDVLENLPRETPDQLYELATVYAALAQPAEVTLEPDPEADAEQARNAELTLDTLKKSVDAGYANAQTLKTNRLFDVIRERADFQQLVVALDTAAQALQLVNRKAGTPDEQLADRQKAAELLGNLTAEQSNELRHRGTLAATLDSMGEIQTGLKKFGDAEKSLGDAIALWRELADAQPGKPQLRLNRIGSQISLGELYRASGRGAEAHRMWQDCLAELEQVRALHARDASLSQQIAWKECQICDFYGRLGAFSFAAHFARRNVLLERHLRPWPDLDFGVVLGAIEGDDALREVCRRVDRQRTSAGGPVWTDGELLQLAKVSNLVNPPALLPEQSLEWIERSTRAAPDAWHLYMLALAQHRAGKSADATATFEKLADSRSLDAAFTGALVAHGAGNAELARERLQKAEFLFVEFCRNTLQESPVGLASPIRESGHWWQLPIPAMLRREAWRVIENAVADEAWLRLIEARADHLLGDTAARDEQFAAAESSDIDVLIARARLLDEFDHIDQSAETAWQQAVERAGDDPLPWIYRGRWYAERGEHEKADTDYAQAASLTPGELNKFLEAGWWVVGPYPPELKEFCPPELDADPSVPVHVIDPQAGLSSAPEAWRSVPTGRWGQVNLKNFPGHKDGASHYALAHVDSPEEQAKLLMIRKTQPLSIWINGELIRDFTPGPTQPHYDEYHRAPVVLRAGRNSILVKSNTADFTVRIGDTPLDRAVLLAEQERFSEAFAAFVELPGADRNDPSGATSFSIRRLVPLLGTDAEHAELCGSLLALAQRAAQNGNAYTSLSAASLCAVRPNPVFDEHAATLVTYADEFVVQQPAAWAHYAALVHYRAGNRERSLELLKQSSSKDWYGLPLESLLAQQSGHEAAARKLLDSAFGVAAEYEASLPDHNRSAFYGKNHFFWWYDWATFLTILREAEQTIRGETTQTDALRARCEALSKSEWSVAPETAVFDHAILFGTIDGRGQPTFPQPFLARGKRLAELGRFDEAETDFNRAVELAPSDPDVLIARANFQSNRTAFENAATDYESALRLAQTSDEATRWGIVQKVALEAAIRSDVFDRLVKRQTKEGGLWSARIFVHAYEGDPQAAHQAALRLEANGGWHPQRAAAALLRDDQSEFERIRDSRPRHASPRETIKLLMLAPSEEPITGELLAASEQFLNEHPNSNEARLRRAVAQYRAGRLDEAQALLEPLGISHLRGIVWPVLAMVHHGRGDESQARQWLVRSDQWMAWQQPGSLSDAPRIFKSPVNEFEDWMMAAVFHREAKRLIDGPAAAEEARQQLAARSEARKKIALEAAAMRKQEAQRRAELAWQRAVELAGDNPMPWIHRGRWYAQHGEHEKADADFAKAASLTPNELNKFLEAGWWVVGPYPPELKEFCPPKIDADPSRTVHIVDPKLGLSEQPVAWRSVSTGELGRVDLRSVFQADSMSAYALTYVYATEERTATLLVGADDAARVWLNGELVHETTAPVYAWGLDRAPVTLRAGRNTLLVKVSQATDGHAFMLRLADGPIDRAFTLAEIGLWPEAVESLRKADPNRSSDDVVDLRSACLLLAAGDLDGYRQECQRMLQQYEQSSAPTVAYHLAWACTLAPDVVSDAERLVQAAQKGLVPQPSERYRIGALGRALYRAGRYDEAIARLTEIADLKNPADDLTLALAFHRRGDSVEAKTALAKAQTWYDKASPKALRETPFQLPHWHWAELAVFQVLYREAKVLIDGDPEFEDKTAAALAARARDELKGQDPIADFDLAVTIQPDQPRLWLACGKRRAELGRLVEAEADFNKAVELNPNDPDVLAARAVFLADAGPSDRAAADFHAALNLFTDAAQKPRWGWGVPIDFELAQREDVFERILALRPQDSRPLMTRMLLRMQHGDVDGMRVDAESMASSGFHLPSWRAAAALWRGDRSECEQLRAVDTTGSDPAFEILLLGLAPTDDTMTARLSSAADRMWKQQPQDSWHRRLLGLSQLRAGQLTEAVANLEGSLTPGYRWQQDGFIWPLLAIANQELGNREAARRWLDRTELWLTLRTEAEAAEVGIATGVWDILPEDCLYAHAYYLEAKTLIDGPEEAMKARDELSARGRAGWQAIQAIIEARRRDFLAKAEADLERAVELAGDDPAPWIRRGRWYAGRGEQAKADADIARAFQLDPNHPLCRLERERQNGGLLAAWDFSNGAEGWRAYGECNLSGGDGVLAVESTGFDPHFGADIKAPSGWKELTICGRFPETSQLDLYWATASSGTSETQKTAIVINGDPEGWQECRLMFQADADLVGLRLDPPNGQPGRRLELAWIVLSDASTEAARTRAVERSPDDPLPWIQRARWYAERGEHEKADADFAKAASLTSDELNKFLEAGWWIAGPYPPTLQEFCPPENDPDPSKPVYVVDSATGISPEPAAWRSSSSDPWGHVSLGAVPSNSSAYALAYVYSPDEQTKLLMIDKTQPLRAWVNGALVEDYAPGEYPVQPHYEPFHRTPIVLRAGRNTILVKSGTRFTARLGDTPRDRAVLLAEQRRFAEAFGALNELPFSRADLEAGFISWNLAPVLMTHDGPQDVYRLNCEAALARLAVADQQIWLKFRIPYVCSQQPNPLFDEHAERLVSLAEEYAAATPALWTRMNAALVNYRAGRFERARSLLTETDLAHRISLPLQALLHHKLGDADAAAKALDSAISAAAAVEKNMESADRSDFHAPGWACWWYEWVPYLSLLAEAEQAIRGVTIATDELTAAAETAAAQRWTTSPELEAFDHAVLLTARGADGSLKYPQPLLARGRRLAELGRFDQAEADFNKAVELAPEDPKMLTDRAAFYAQRGDVERATADFGAAFELVSMPADENYVRRLQIGRELANHEAVYARAAELRPDDYRIWLGRGMHHAGHGRWKQAADDYTQVDLPQTFFVLRTMERACLEWLAGDMDGYKRTCQELLDQNPSERLDFQVRRGLVVACGIAPEGNLSAAELLQRAERLAAEKESDLWVHLGLAIALYRAGRFDDARLQCEKERRGPVLADERLALVCLRAMCLHQLGRTAEARQLLQAAQAWSGVTPAIPDPGAATSKYGAPEITMYLVRQVLYQQAAELLEAEPPNE